MPVRKRGPTSSEEQGYSYSEPSEGTNETESSKSSRIPSIGRRKLLGLIGLGGATATGGLIWGEREGHIDFVDHDLLDPQDNYVNRELNQKARDLQNVLNNRLEGDPLPQQGAFANVAINYTAPEGLPGKPPLIGDAHYGTLEIALVSDNRFQYIQDYAEGSYTDNYLDEVTPLFKDTVELAYTQFEDDFDISGEIDENDDQLLGAEIYMLGERNSRAGRYFSSTDLRNYSQTSSEELEEVFKSEIGEENGFYMDYCEDRLFGVCIDPLTDRL